MKHALELLDVVDVILVDVHVGGPTACSLLGYLGNQFLFVFNSLSLTLNLDTLFAIPVIPIRLLARLKLVLVESVLNLNNVAFLIDLVLQFRFQHLSSLFLGYFLVQVLLHLNFVLLGLLLVYVDLSQLIFLQISVSRNGFSCHGNLPLVLCILALHFETRVGSPRHILLVQPNPRLQRLLIDLPLLLPLHV